MSWDDKGRYDELGISFRGDPHDRVFSDPFVVARVATPKNTMELQIYACGLPGWQLLMWDEAGGGDGLVARGEQRK